MNRVPPDHEYDERGICKWCGLNLVHQELKAMEAPLLLLLEKLEKQGQHVVASRIDCAIDEVRSALGCWNHAIK